jgi:hypothetical protein
MLPSEPSLSTFRKGIPSPSWRVGRSCYLNSSYAWSLFESVPCLRWGLECCGFADSFRSQSALWSVVLVRLGIDTNKSLGRWRSLGFSGAGTMAVQLHTGKHFVGLFVVF